MSDNYAGLIQLLELADKHEKYAAATEVGLLAASVDAIRTAVAERDALAAERDALRADAERYRWLRDIGDADWRPMASRIPEGARGIDAAIDANRGAA